MYDLLLIASALSVVFVPSLLARLYQFYDENIGNLPAHTRASRARMPHSIS
jgi:hypothetical protein